MARSYNYTPPGAIVSKKVINGRPNRLLKTAADGTLANYIILHIGDTAPDNPELNDLWLDTDP